MQDSGLTQHENDVNLCGDGRQSADAKVSWAGAGRERHATVFAGGLPGKRRSWKISRVAMVTSVPRQGREDIYNALTSEVISPGSGKRLARALEKIFLPFTEIAKIPLEPAISSTSALNSFLSSSPSLEALGR
jgi:hypothetical protein